MSLFGKKNGDDTHAGDDGDDIPMNLDGGTPETAGGGKNRTTLIAGGLVAVLGLAGAYVLFSSGEEPAPAAFMDADRATMLPQENAGAPGMVMPGGADVGAATPVVADPLAAAPPMPGSTENTPPDISAVTAETTPVTAGNASTAAVDGATVPAPAATNAPATDAANPTVAPAAPAADAAATGVTAVVTPAAGDVSKAEDPAVPVATDGVAPVAGATPAVSDKAVTTDTQAAATTEDLPAPVVLSEKTSTGEATPVTPPADLPAPEIADKPVQKTGDKVADLPVSEKAEEKKPETRADTDKTDIDEPSKAEMAIVENGDILNELTEPAETSPIARFKERAILEGNVQDALIRDMPKGYLLVEKNKSSDDADSRLATARSALARGSNTVALQMFNELYKQYPLDSRVLMGRAVAMQRLGQNEEALLAYEDVLNVNPKNLEALTNMLGLIKVQDPALAVEKLAALREAYPENADVTAQLGIAYAGAGAYEEALRYLDMAEALSPDSVNVLYNKAVLYDKMGRSRDAGQLYRQILRMDAEGTARAGLPLEAIRRRLSDLQ